MASMEGRKEMLEEKVLGGSFDPGLKVSDFFEKEDICLLNDSRK